MDTPKKSGRRPVFLLQAVILVAVVVAVYAPSLNSQFQLDDSRIIVGNIYLRLPDLHPRSLWRAAIQDKGNNRPLPNLTLALNHYFNGERPFGYHLVNLAILVATAFGVWLVLIKLLGQLGCERRRSEFAAWLAALSWSVHPLNIMAVTYVSQRYTCMAGAFSIWSICFFHLANEARKRKWLYGACAGICCGFALLSKETALPLPLILVCYKLYFFDGLGPGWLRRNWKWVLAPVIFYGLAAAMVLRPEMTARLATDVAKLPYSLGQRSLSEPRAFVWYLSLIVFPLPNSIALFHHFPVSTSLFQPPATAISALLLLAAVFLAVFKARQWRVFSFAVIWYLGQLVVEALPLPIDLVNEHRLYLASLSVMVPAIAGLVLKMKKTGPAAAWVLMIAAFFAAFSFQRNRDWQTEVKLSKDSAWKDPQSPLVWSLYCKALGKADRFDQAIPACKIAVRLSPENYQARLTLGVIYLQAGQMGPAREQLEKAVSIYPYEYGAHSYLGSLLLMTGEMKLAEAELLRAVELSSQSAVQPMFNLALFYSENKDFENAAKWLKAVASLDPDHVQAHYLLAQIYLVLEKDSEYIEQLRKTVENDPQWTQPRLELARALAERNQCREALDLVKNLPTRESQQFQIQSRCPKP